MRIFSSLASYYQQAVRTETVKKSIELTSSVGYYTFRGVKYFALASIISVSLPVIIPVSVTLYSGNRTISKIERWGREFSNPAIAALLFHLVDKMNRVTEYAFKGFIVFSFLPLVHSLRVINRGANYLEDRTLDFSQRTMDALAIPAQVSIPPKRLRSILSEWESHAAPGEDRMSANREIFSLYESSRNIAFNLARWPLRIALNNRFLRDLPNLFHYKPFCKLTILNLSGNRLLRLPESIAALENLESLYLENNRLTAFPEILYRLPSGCRISVGGNRFSAQEAERIVNRINLSTYEGPQISGISVFDVTPRERARALSQAKAPVRGEYRAIYNSYKKLCNSIERHPQDLSNLKTLQRLRIWLDRLQEISDHKAKESTRKALIINIVNYLEEANRNADFRRVFANIIEDASQTCGDRVALSVLHLDIAYQLQKMDTRDMKKLSNFLLRGCFAMELLEECARQKVASMREVDEIEVYLGYPIALKKELALPISQQTMSHFHISKLSRRELEIAKEYVTNQLNNKETAANYLIKNEKWLKALANWEGSKEKFIIIEENKTGELKGFSPDYNLIQYHYEQALKDLSKQVLEQ